MVNGNYVLYGDRSSESEIIDDHVQTRTAERKYKRKCNRTANDLQRTLNLAQIDNETDAIKYEKRIKEPRLLRYVATTDVEENFVTEKYETYDLKATEERPRRYAFVKKPRNPADGSVNYAYSRSSSSCSSPNGNLPTISEHSEQQYGTYRVKPAPSPKIGEILNGYETKLDKYFAKPKDLKFAANVTYKGSHPDSLYRVPTESGVGGDKVAKMLRILRWPIALVAICIALAVFVYFLMPDNIDRRVVLAENTTVLSESQLKASESKRHKVRKESVKKGSQSQGTKTAEIDFYDNENDKTDITDSIAETIPHRKLSVEPVFPSHITPEVQYGNERADTDKLRTPKILDGVIPNPTERPHITHKPEKPLEVSIKEAIEISTEAINGAETINEFANYGEKETSKRIDAAIKTYTPGYKDPNVGKPYNENHYLLTEPRTPPEIQELHSRQTSNVDFNFTSGHSKFFGIGIEDAEKMKSTTQSSLYNTRVSPTLPTWRSNDATTTKKYPVNFEVPQCRSTRLTLCRGILPYDLAGSPAVVGGLHVTSLLPQIEYLVATNCSDRVRHFACALMEPECKPPPFPTKKPCRSLCKAIMDNCEDLIPRELVPLFDCSEYSLTNCVQAQAPCFPREHRCKDGTCIPGDWICDGNEDCPGGEDEVICTQCEKNEFRCHGGSCIPRRWLCDGYADCPDGQDESEGCEKHAKDHHVAGEPGEEPSGSAPAPAVRRLNRLPGPARGEVDNSKELLVTSDSNNALKRNYTRRPSTSRLTPYTRKPIQTTNQEDNQQTNEPPRKRKPSTRVKTTTLGPQLNESTEDINAGDLGFFEELKKITKPEDEMTQRDDHKMYTEPVARTRKPTRLDRTITKLEKVIDGAALMKKAVEEQHLDASDNNTSTTSNEKFDDNLKLPAGPGSSHKSPCPGGELRCVDGRCITILQLCDGTIDCTDHADEDNCYT